MGGGAVRNLEEAFVPERPLDAMLSARLGKALERYDTLDAEFKAAREDERFQQRVKMWNNVSKEVDSYLRAVGNLLHQAHQLSLDIGSDGGGANIRPFMEDMGRRFDKLFYKLQDGFVVAMVGSKELGRTPLEDVSFDFVERTAIEWLVVAIDSKK